MSTLYWITSAAALVGVWLNIQRHPACFLVWMVTNLIWCYADFVHGLHPQSALMFIYFMLSVWGFYSWTRRPPNSPPGVTANLETPRPPQASSIDRETVLSP